VVTAVLEQAFWQLRDAVLCICVGLSWQQNQAANPAVHLPLSMDGRSRRVTSSSLPPYPSDTYPTDDIERAIWASALPPPGTRAGVRMISVALPPVETKKSGISESERPFFWLVIALYGVNYVYHREPTDVRRHRVIVERVLELRQVPLLLLWYEVIRKRRQKSYLCCH